MNMESKVNRVTITADLSVRQVMQKLNDTGMEIVFVTGPGGVLSGVVTNGDVRSYILRSGSLEARVADMMTSDPVVVVRDGRERESAGNLMKSRRLSCIPIVDEARRLVDAIWWEQLFEEKQRLYEPLGLPVVIMAGGMGTRLEPFTRVLPKPLIPIGDKSIIEIIMDKYKAHGCEEFHISINYKANLIKAYFGDMGSAYSINYIEEPKFLGTAGSLKLLEGRIDRSFFVNNCDIIVDVDYARILDQHRSSANAITLVCSLRNFRIPYGIIEMDAERNLCEIREKPEYNFHVNTGMYLLEPSVFKHVPRDRFFHITDLIKACRAAGEKVGVHSIHDKAWTDIGQVEELFLTLKKFENQKR